MTCSRDTLPDFAPARASETNAWLASRTHTHAMFAGSSLSSLSELSDLPEDEVVAPPAAATIVFDGPFASQPDLEAVKYLKDTSKHVILSSQCDNHNETRPQAPNDGWPGMILWKARLIIFWNYLASLCLPRCPRSML